MFVFWICQLSVKQTKFLELESDDPKLLVNAKKHVFIKKHINLFVTPNNLNFFIFIINNQKAEKGFEKKNNL